MMYRRTEGEEESGSDWDELTPRNTAASSPTSPLPLVQVAGGTPQPVYQSTLHDTSDPSIIVHDATAPSTLLPSSSTQPMAALVLEDTSTPINFEQSTSNATTFSRDTALNAQPLGMGRSTSDQTRFSQGTSLNTQLSGKARAESQDVGSSTRSHVIMEAGQGTRRHHFLGNLTSIETAQSPHPPPAKNVTFTKPVYRVQEEEEPVGESLTVEGGAKEGEGLNLEDVVVMDKEYGVDLEFTTVSGRTANYLATAHLPPHAYMHDVAKRCEVRSQRCVEEVCSSFRLVSDFIIAVILGSTHCLLQHVLRKLCCGLAHIASDALYKPLVTLCFNGFLWPLVAALVQLSRGGVLIVGPLLEVASVLMSWLVQIARVCRLVSITTRYCQPQHDKQHQHI